MPLAFVGKQGLRWDGGPEHGGTEIFFEGVYAPEGPLPDRLKWLIANSAKMAVPAGVYLAMNMLGFVALKRVDAGTFAVAVDGE